MPIVMASATALFAALTAAAIIPGRAIRVHGRVIDVIVQKLLASLTARKVLRPLGIEWLLYFRHHRHVVRITESYRQESDPAALRAKIADMNLVFTVTAGRSGTLFLQKLCALLPNTTSQHEPDPAFHAYLRRVKNHPGFAKEFLVHYKLPYIVKLPTRNYVELGHVFCKGFLEPLLDLGITPNLLSLRREPRLVAMSYFERYSVPERTIYGIEFLLSPRFKRTLPLPGWRRMSDYQLLFWYALEIERRQREYSRLVRDAGGNVYDVTATELHDPRVFIDLAQTLDLIHPTTDCDTLVARHAAVVGTSWNQNGPPFLHHQGDIDAEEEEVWRAVSAADPQLRASVEQRYMPAHTADVVSAGP